jgi:hypothetical protein
LELNQAIELLQKAVKHTGNIDQKHIDLTLVPAEDRGHYEAALAVAQQALKEGQLTRDQLFKKLNLD